MNKVTEDIPVEMKRPKRVRYLTLNHEHHARSRLRCDNCLIIVQRRQIDSVELITPPVS